ncbi:MAG: hypothetical protein M3271_11660, partial [Actinomycetota bacterium]|nr:hypothetical protein [Actinomycetota bacterium]
MTFERTIRCGPTALVAAVLVIGLVAPASATPEGRNGRIAVAGGSYERQDIRSVLPDGSRERRLTDTVKRNESQVRWSPAGSRIVFAAGTGDTFGIEIFVMRADGSRVRRLTDNELLDASPDWSPRGRRIVFIRGRQSRGLYTMRSDGSRVRRIDYDGYVGYWARWSPSGRRIAFEGPDDVFSIRLDGSRRRRLTTDITKKKRGTHGDTYGGI